MHIRHRISFTALQASDQVTEAPISFALSIAFVYLYILKEVVEQHCLYMCNRTEYFLNVQQRTAAPPLHPQAGPPAKSQENRLGAATRS